MRISAVKVYEGYAPAHGQNVTLVHVETGGGPDGWGDYRLAVQEHLVAECLREIGPWLVGEDPFRIEHIWQDVFRGTVWRGGPVVQTAISAIDTALWDLKGKAAGLPVYELLGGLARHRVRVYRHVAPPTTDDARRRLQDELDGGYTAVRVSIGDRQMDARGGYDPRRAVEHGLEEFRLLREFCGPEVELCVDVHTRLGPIEAVEYCNGIAPYRPFFVEDALRPENPEVYRLLRAKTGVRLATGEHLFGKWAFRELIAENLVDYLRVDLCHVGGITETKKIAAWAEAYYEEMALHCTSGAVGDAASLHVNLAIPNCAVQEFPGRGGAPAGLIEGGYTVERGHLVPTGEPGLGLRVDTAALVALEAPRGNPRPRWRRADGSVQDW